MLVLFSPCGAKKEPTDLKSLFVLRSRATGTNEEQRMNSTMLPQTTS
jgi:hypothetical protein